MARARWKARDNAPATDIPARTRVIAISSGKGGVGQVVGHGQPGRRPGQPRASRSGVLDADIWGFSVPRMLGIEGRLGPSTTRTTDRPKMRPIEKRVGAGRLKVVSMGFLSPRTRPSCGGASCSTGPCSTSSRTSLWGDLDYLLIDMPPGTGDVQMGLARMLPRAEMIIVTTPALAAQKVAVRAADMARKGYLRVVGVIENMSGFTCDHGEHYALFGSGGGERLAHEIGAPLLGQIPLEPEVSTGGDIGEPAALGDGAVAAAFAELVDAVLEAVPVVEMHDCTARIFDLFLTKEPSQS